MMHKPRHATTRALLTGAVVLALAAVAPVALAAGKAGKPAKAGKAKAAPAEPGPAERLEKIKEGLGVDDATARKLLASVKSHRTSMKALRENANEIHTALAEALEAPKPDEKRIGDLLKAMALNRKAMEGERWMLFESLDDLLLPSQKAKFLRFAHHMKMKRMMKRMSDAGESDDLL